MTSDETIARLAAREVLDSRGRPTVEVEIHASGGSFGRAIVPSGASTGAAEALELRDRESPRYDGYGVRQAVSHVMERIAPAVVGLDPANQTAVDERLLELDGTPQKSKLGGNALLAVSMAAAHVGAAARRVPLYQHFHELLAEHAKIFHVRLLHGRAEGESIADVSTLAPTPRMPLPMTNMISGGLHAGGNLDFQDVLIMPVGASDYATGLEWIVRVYWRLGRLLGDAGYEGWLVGDEGGFGPRLRSNREAVEFVVRAIEAAGLRPGEDVTIALDVAATHFFRDGAYHLHSEGGHSLDSDAMIDRLEQWVDAFPIRSIEDGLAEEDWDGWRRLTERLGQRVWLVGDDLFATNSARVRRAIEQSTANCVLVKVNQIGTITETLDTIVTARAAGYSFVVSARSGETEDS
ncbi:MAG: phosphopyruvate hydratase, partial [Planctomycetales bacterium]|nr:phosphopyruvate hydratase [Planctomycetales bacterium]